MLLRSPAMKQQSWDYTSSVILVASVAVAAGAASFTALRRRQKRHRCIQQMGEQFASIWGNSSATGTQVVSMYDDRRNNGNTDKQKPSLYVITGATSGLGLQTARHLASLSHPTHIILGCRNGTLGCTVADELKSSSSSMSRLDVECIHLDLTSFASVRKFAEAVIDKSKQLGVQIRALINNAGVYSISGTTIDGYQITFQTNALSPFLLTELLLPHTTNDFRVINVSSEMMKMVWNSTRKEGRTFPPKVGGDSDWDYALSKACQGLHAHVLNMKWAHEENEKRRAFAVEPGLVETEIARHKSSWIRKLTYLVLSPLVRTIDQGTATVLFCTLAPSEHLDHGYYSNEGDHDDETKPFYYANCKANVAPRCCRREEDAELQDKVFRDIYGMQITKIW